MNDTPKNNEEEKLSRKLMAFTEDPKENLWARVEGRLMEETSSELKNKLQSFTDEPSENVWNRVTQGVSRDTEVLLKDQLGTFTEIPKEILWVNILHQTAGNRIYSYFIWASRIAAIAFLFVFVSMPLGDEKFIKLSFATASQKSVPNSFKSELSNSVEKNNNDEAKSDVKKKYRVIFSKTLENGLIKEPIFNSIKKSNQVLANQTHFTINYSECDINIPILPIENFIDPINTKNLIIAKKENVLTEIPKSNKIDSIHQKKLSFYFLATPVMGYNHVKSKKEDHILVENINRISAFSTQRLGIRIEAGVEKLISQRWSVNFSGIYNQRTQVIKYSLIEEGKTQVKSSLYNYTVNPTQFDDSLIINIKNLGISAGANYRIRGKRTDNRIGIAVEYQYNLNTLVKETSPGRINPSYLFAHFYYRRTISINSRFEFMIQPTLNYSVLTSQQSQLPFYIKPYELGLSFGLKYKLKN